MARFVEFKCKSTNGGLYVTLINVDHIESANESHGEVRLHVHPSIDEERESYFRVEESWEAVKLKLGAE